MRLNARSIAQRGQCALRYTQTVTLLYVHNNFLSLVLKDFFFKGYRCASIFHDFLFLFSSIDYYMFVLSFLIGYSIKSLFCAACVPCVLIRPMIVYALRDRRPFFFSFFLLWPHNNNAVCSCSLFVLFRGGAFVCFIPSTTYFTVLLNCSIPPVLKLKTDPQKRKERKKN